MVDYNTEKVYQVGPFRVSVKFDTRKLLKETTDYFKHIWPTIKYFEARSEDADNHCSISIKRRRHNGLPEGTSVMGFEGGQKYCFRDDNRCTIYSSDFRTIEFFIDTRCNHFSYIVPFVGNLVAFSPFFIKHGSVIFHSAGVSYKDKGFIFIGPSGAGKTTICRILAQGGARILSDEKIIVHNMGTKGGMSFAHPLWIYSQGGRDLAVRFQKRKICGPVLLKGIFFLSQGRKFAVKKLSFRDNIERLCQHAVLFHPRIFQCQEALFSTVMHITRNAKLFELCYDKSDKIFPLLESL